MGKSTKKNHLSILSTAIIAASIASLGIEKNVNINSGSTEKGLKNQEISKNIVLQLKDSPSCRSSISLFT